MFVKLLITKILNHIFLTYELVIGNRRLILPTIIGLIIALTVISQSGVLIESYRQEIFEEVVFGSLEDYYYYDGDVTIGMYRMNLQRLSKFPDYNHYNSLISKAITQVNYSNYIKDYYWFSRMDSHIWLNRSKYDDPEEGMYTRGISIYSSSSNESYAQLEQILSTTGKGRLPKNSSEIILIYRTGEYFGFEEDLFENVTLNSQVNITLMPWAEVIHNKTVKIVGVIEYKSGHRSYYDNSTVFFHKYFEGIWENYGFLTQPVFLQQIIEESKDEDQSVVERLDVGMRCKIFLDKTNFDAYNINNEIYKLENFIEALYWQLNEAGLSSWVNSEILWLMRQYETTVFGLLIIMLLLSIPVLCIALYLVVYSFGLIRRQKQEQIGIIKTRGGSWLQILVVLLGEMLLSTVLAVLIGFLLSTILADVVMRSTNYLEFLGAPVPVLITMTMVQGLIFWGLILALILNFRNIIRMSRQEINETLEPTETRQPAWKRYYLDVVIFVIGTATWIIFMTLLRSGGDMFGPSVYFLYIIVSLLGIPSPFFMFFGTIMVIARFFPFIMKKLSEFLWQLEGGINAFAIRNIVRHKQAANRAVLLITLALSFSILSSSLIFSLDETERLRQYYSVGADISVPTGSLLNESVLEILNQNISNLKSISGVLSARLYSYDFFNRNYHLLFVDPYTYAETAFMDPSFGLSSSISNLMNQLKDNETIILYNENLKEMVSKPKIGDKISFYIENDSVSFRVGGTFKYWPTMYPYSYLDPFRNFWGVGSLGMFDRFNLSNYFEGMKAKYQVKIASMDNIDETIERIYNATGITPESPALSYKEYKEGFGRRFSLSILNSDLIVCLAVAIIGVIMFAFFTYVERGKEIGVERALGMTQFQTAHSFLVEAATILSFGSIIGYFTGVYFVTMFLQITQFGESIPPLVVTYPTALLIQILLGIFITASIGTIIPAYMATRKDISRILKVE
ncbi:MAG: FtsX-like permease family protein [Promethearchaeota archaeon]